VLAGLIPLVINDENTELPLRPGAILAEFRKSAFFECIKVRDTPVEPYGRFPNRDIVDMLWHQGQPLPHVSRTSWRKRLLVRDDWSIVESFAYSGFRKWVNVESNAHPNGVFIGGRLPRVAKTYCNNKFVFLGNYSCVRNMDVCAKLPFSNLLCNVNAKLRSISRQDSGFSGLLRCHDRALHRGILLGGISLRFPLGFAESVKLTFGRLPERTRGTGKNDCEHPNQQCCDRCDASLVFINEVPDASLGQPLPYDRAANNGNTLAKGLVGAVFLAFLYAVLKRR